MEAARATVAGAVDRDAVVSRARDLGVLGWVRVDDDGVSRVHAEGGDDAVAALVASLGDAATVERVKVEGHEQFAIRGVPHGTFVLSEHQASTRHFDLRLEVDGVMKSWALPKGPSLDPGVKRLAVEVPDHAVGGDREGPDRIIWDQGVYEQGGRVPWPEAITRGHAVFVLHGEKLRGGFALQRTPRGWLFVKRKDEHARPGSDIVAEQPGSVLSR
ncbi:MAG: hypothetical protein JHC84_10610 [Solirubrobacteraceae bacterium]|nr:hypothetical protein [Solirubrobacteraceae bacterium]